MRRVMLSFCLPLVAALLMWGVRSGQPCAATARPAALVAPTAAPLVRVSPSSASCKPEAPIAVSLAVPEGSSGNVLRAAFSVRPLLELADLQWSWELSPDVSLDEGEALGAALPQRGVLTEREVVIRVPNDGLHHTAKLVVTGVLRGAAADVGDAGDAGDVTDAARAGDLGVVGSDDDVAGPETVTVVRTLTWGEPDPATAIVWSPDAETGALVPVAVVPGAHEPAITSPRGAQR
jgi:hypothetical protein